nr:ribosomal protein S10 [Ipomoea batatas]
MRWLKGFPRYSKAGTQPIEKCVSQANRYFPQKLEIGTKKNVDTLRARAEKRRGSLSPYHLIINRRVLLDALINRTRRGVSQKERPPKVTTTKIRIVIRSFYHPFLENLFWGLPPYTRKIGLPESRVLYTVLRSPHIDKKSREQFEMKIKKQFLVIKTETHELRKKFFRLKRRATRRT